MMKKGLGNGFSVTENKLSAKDELYGGTPALTSDDSSMIGSASGGKLWVPEDSGRAELELSMMRLGKIYISQSLFLEMYLGVL